MSIRINKSSRGYQAFISEAHKGAYTAAAMVVAGYAILRDKNADTARLEATGSHGKPQVLSYLMGSSATRYWVNQGWLESDRLSANGINAVNARVHSPTAKYHTSAQEVWAMVGFIVKGEAYLSGTHYKTDTYKVFP